MISRCVSRFFVWASVFAAVVSRSGFAFRIAGVMGLVSSLGLKCTKGKCGL